MKVLSCIIIFFAALTLLVLFRIREKKNLYGDEAEPSLIESALVGIGTIVVYLLSLVQCGMILTQT